MWQPHLYFWWRALLWDSMHCGEGHYGYLMTGHMVQIRNVDWISQKSNNYVLYRLIHKCHFTNNLQFQLSSLFCHVWAKSWLASYIWGRKPKYKDKPPPNPKSLAIFSHAPVYQELAICKLPSVFSVNYWSENSQHLSFKHEIKSFL